MKCVVGLSGGVDSAVAAALLKEQGYEVIGVTEILSGYESTEDARDVAEKLGIRHVILDLRERFACEVIDPFVGEYLAGRTPNPCVRCNRCLKWQGLIDYADSCGAEYIATGHYAGVRDGRLLVSGEKDQSYALYMLSSEQLSRTLFPLGKLTKAEVRAKAEEIGLSVAHKSDSMEICFIPDHDYARYIREYTGTDVSTGLEPGNFVLEDGTVLGRHKGLIHYTVGQRKGLGIAYSAPLYVLELRTVTNEVVLGENDRTLKNVVYASDLYLPEQLPERAYGRIRYNHKGASCSVSREGDLLICVFDEPVRAVTPGQALVLYDGDILLGGGTILNA